jgi:hypothetical protein
MGKRFSCGIKIMSLRLNTVFKAFKFILFPVSVFAFLLSCCSVHGAYNTILARGLCTIEVRISGTFLVCRDGVQEKKRVSLVIGDTIELKDGEFIILENSSATIQLCFINPVKVIQESKDR